MYIIWLNLLIHRSQGTLCFLFPGGVSGKESASNAGNVRDMNSIPGLGRFPGEGHGNPLQYSCLENPLDRGAWWATVHRIAKSWTWPKWLSTHAQMDRFSSVAQSCPTLCDPMDCSPPGSLVHGIFQAWILEWVAISFSRGSSRPRDQTWVSCIVGRRFTV